MPQVAPPSTPALSQRFLSSLPPRPRSRQPPQFLALAALACAPLAACTSYAPPQLNVTKAAVTDETPSGIVISFTIEAINQNPVELPLHDVRYTLSVGGEPVFTGIRSPEATLRRLGTQPITIPAVIKIDRDHPRPTGVAQYAIEGHLTYSTPGEIQQRLYDLHIHRPAAEFHQSGTIDLSGGQ